ncbi:MAG: hypothetical protein HGGPFJEG_00309 [Ignavibacteria bacterium]|nr:hypothetical protein [Ignavibacteria bacterium]
MKQPAIILLLIIFITINSASSQRLQNNEGSESLILDLNSASIYEHVNSVKKNIVTEDEYLNSGIIKIQIEDIAGKNNKDFSGNIFNDLGSNFNFGAVTENYAFISFTPSMHIQPAEFISIYANHNLMKLIPFSEMNKYAYSVFIQGLAIAGTQKSMELLFNSKSWITQAAAFTAKYLVLNLLIKPNTKSDNRKLLPWIQDEWFYYSVSIKF